MNAKTLEAIKRHGEALLRVFPYATEQNPVALCKILRRIENAVAKPILDYTNGENGVTLEAVDIATDKALKRVHGLLNTINSHCPPECVFINRDPRGYALKLDNEAGNWLQDWQLAQRAAGLPALYADMGGYGILAPDLNQ